MWIVFLSDCSKKHTIYQVLKQFDLFYLQYPSLLHLTYSTVCTLLSQLLLATLLTTLLTTLLPPSYLILTMAGSLYSIVPEHEVLRVLHRRVLEQFTARQKVLHMKYTYNGLKQNVSK